MGQLMPLPLTVSCFSKIQIGFTFLPFWYRPTRVVLDKGPLNRCVCVCNCCLSVYLNITGLRQGSGIFCNQESNQVTCGFVHMIHRCWRALTMCKYWAWQGRTTVVHSAWQSTSVKCLYCTPTSASIHTEWWPRPVSCWQDSRLTKVLSQLSVTVKCNWDICIVPATEDRGRITKQSSVCFPMPIGTLESSHV